MDQEGESQAMDWDEYERSAIEDYEGVATIEQLSDVNVRYLGRRAPLPQALRGVRDREIGRHLNSLRARLKEKSKESAHLMR